MSDELTMEGRKEGGTWEPGGRGGRGSRTSDQVTDLKDSHSISRFSSLQVREERASEVEMASTAATLHAPHNSHAPVPEGAPVGGDAQDQTQNGDPA